MRASKLPHMLKTRIIAGFSALAAAGTLVAVVPATADAGPRVGSHCSRAQLGDLRIAAGSTPVICISGRSGTKWMRTATLDPQIRKAGAPCGRGYNVAKARNGKALLCANGRWRAGPYTY